MSRSYFHCPRCRKRMRKFSKNAEKEQALYYYCPNCGDRSTYLLDINGWSDDWPQEVFDEAVRDGVLTQKGRVI